MWRLIDATVCSGFWTAWFFAGFPTSRSPSSNATTEGVTRSPSELTMISGSPPSMTAIALLVVPRSIPRIFSEAIVGVR